MVLVPDDKRGEVLLEASENVWGDLIDKMSDPELLQVCSRWISMNRFTCCSICRAT